MQHEGANYEAYATDHAVGALVRGRVRAVAPFGVLVELAPNVQGLLEILDFAAGAPSGSNGAAFGAALRRGAEVVAALRAGDTSAIGLPVATARSPPQARCRQDPGGY